eukprot:scaffold1504_cov417-Prasinococcus_capsulatus_cf.AAC.27
MFGSEARSFIKRISAIDQDYFPEHLGKMLIVNAPTIFKAIWTLVKPLLDKRTQAKISTTSFGPWARELDALEDSLKKKARYADIAHQAKQNALKALPCVHVQQWLGRSECSGGVEAKAGRSSDRETKSVEPRDVQTRGGRRNVRIL